MFCWHLTVIDYSIILFFIWFIIIYFFICFFRESLSFHWKESKQGQQSIFLKPQDKETAVCKPAVQEDLVGSREALCKASVINQGIENHREEWTRCSCKESWNWPPEEIRPPDYGDVVVRKNKFKLVDIICWFYF